MEAPMAGGLLANDISIQEGSNQGAAMNATAEGRCGQTATAGDAAGKAGEAEHANQPANGKPESICQQAACSFETARQKARTWTEAIANHVRQQPVKCVIQAFGIGMIVGMLRARRRRVEDVSHA